MPSPRRRSTRKRPAPQRPHRSVNVDDIVEGEIKLGVIKTLVRWVLTQGPLVIGVYTALGLMIWGLVWSVRYQIPAHVEQARTSKVEMFNRVEKIAVDNNTSRERETILTTNAIKHLGETFERSTDRQEKSARETINILKELIAKPKSDSPFKKSSPESK